MAEIEGLSITHDNRGYNITRCPVEEARRNNPSWCVGMINPPLAPFVEGGFRGIFLMVKRQPDLQVVRG